MNEEQIKSLIDQLKAAGVEEEQIMDIFYETFKRGKMDRKDLETLAEAMGYELTDDFKNEPTPDPIESANIGDLSEADLEEAKEIAPGESKEEFEDKLEDMGEVEAEEESEEDKEGDEESESDSEEEKSEEESEDEDEGEDEDVEWEEAQKLFKI